MNPFRAEGEEDVIWNRGRVLLQSHEEFAYDVIIGVAASGFYGPKDIGFFAFDDVELVRRSVQHEFFAMFSTGDWGGEVPIEGMKFFRFLAN